MTNFKMVLLFVAGFGTACVLFALLSLRTEANTVVATEEPVKTEKVAQQADVTVPKASGCCVVHYVTEEENKGKKELWQEVWEYARKNGFRTESDPPPNRDYADYKKFLMSFPEEGLRYIKQDLISRREEIERLDKRVAALEKKKKDSCPGFGVIRVVQTYCDPYIYAPNAKSRKEVLKDNEAEKSEEQRRCESEDRIIAKELSLIEEQRRVLLNATYRINTIHLDRIN